MINKITEEQMDIIHIKLESGLEFSIYENNNGNIVLSSDQPLKMIQIGKPDSISSCYLNELMVNTLEVKE